MNGARSHRHRSSFEPLWRRALTALFALCCIGSGCECGQFDAALSIKKTHSGSFMRGQQARYTLVVSNDRLVDPTRGTVAVTDSPPAGETLISMSGNGWTCPAGGSSCTRGEALPPGQSYPPITVVVDVLSGTATQLVNHATVSGGASPDATDSDTADIYGSALTVVKTHTGTFAQGQRGAQYTVTVSNSADAGTTSGTVTVTEAAPSGETLISMSGTGWACASDGGNTCSRSESLAPGATYPPIVVTVDVSAGAGSPLVNGVTVQGGDSSPGNASDSTVVSPSAPVVGLVVEPGSSISPLGRTVQFSALAQRQGGTSFDVTAQASWTSSNPSVAVVNLGAVTGTAVSAQPVTIQATYAGFTAQASFTVTSAGLVSISVRPDPATVLLGATTQLTAIGTFSDATQGDITTSVFWTSSAPGVAPVANVSGAQGIVTGLQTSAQPVTITATDEATGIQGSTPLAVATRPGFGSFLQYVTISFDGHALADHGASVLPAAIDRTGRFVAFESFSTNLLATPTVNLQDDVYLRDTSCIPPGQACTPTRRQSLTALGEEPLAANILAGMSSDGSIVAFLSGAPNITSSGSQVFEITGSDPATLRDQSLDIGGRTLDNTQCGAECGQEAAISTTGRFLAFVSSDFTVGQGNTLGQAFVHDNCLGVPVTQTPPCVPGPTLISRSGTGHPLSDGVAPAAFGRTLSVSADGRFATFAAIAPELGNDLNLVVLWVIDRQSQGLTPTLASIDPAGLAVAGGGVSMTEDGRYISFVALAPATNVSTVYRRDLQSGITTVVASDATCYGLAMSADGEFVAFLSGANPLDLPDLPDGEYAYVAEVATRTIHLVSVDSRGNPVQVLGTGASLSGDGARVVFQVLDRQNNTAQLVIALTGF